MKFHIEYIDGSTEVKVGDAYTIYQGGWFNIYDKISNIPVGDDLFLSPSVLKT